MIMTSRWLSPHQPGSHIEISQSNNWIFFSVWKLNDNCSCLLQLFLFYTVPGVVYPLENITVTEGDNKTLTCNISGSTSLFVTWTEVKSQNRTIGITRELIHINRNESGEYKCEAGSSCGNDATSTFLIVQCK